MPDDREHDHAGEPGNGLENPSSWRLQVVQEFCEYDGALLDFLASGPTGFRGHDGHWLVSWRSGGRLSASLNTPPELAGIERWLAVPLSSTRERQLLEGHVSVREAIAFSEAGHLYELRGADPLAPTWVARAQLWELPESFLPTADLTARGQPMPELGPPPGTKPIEVRIHLVPNFEGPESPSLSDSGAVQGALQRFLGWAAAVAYAEATAPERKPPTISAGPPKWSAFSLTRATPGTLLLSAEARIDEKSQREALLAAFERLKTVVSEARDRSRKGDNTSQPGNQGPLLVVAALVALADLLRSAHLSLSVRWSSGEATDCALIGPPMADTIAQLGTDAEQPRLEPVRSAIIRVTLTEEDVGLLRLSLDPAGGGLQKLIATLRDQLQQTGEGMYVLPLSADQVEKVIRYVQEYGQGGYQDRLRPVYEALYRIGIAFVGLR
jgi:hypothetical protein